MANNIPSYIIEPDYDYLSGYDKDFDNLPTAQETSRAEGVLRTISGLISTTGDVLQSYFYSKSPGNTYYVTPAQDKSSNFLFVGVAALALIVIFKRKR